MFYECWSSAEGHRLLLSSVLGSLHVSPDACVVSGRAHGRRHRAETAPSAPCLSGSPSEDLEGGQSGSRGGWELFSDQESPEITGLKNKEVTSTGPL